MPILQVVLALIVLVVLAWMIDRYFPGSKTRTIMGLVMALIVVGVGLWLINTYIPMAKSIKAILNIVVVASVCVFVLQVTGLWPEIERVWNKLVGRRRIYTQPPRSESAPPPHPVR